MKGKQHIALLLLLAFSAYLGHNLVPHHHHDGVLCHNEEAAPNHCHAFNNLVFAKYQSSGIYRVEHTLQAFLLPADENEPGLPGPKTTAFNYFKPPLPEALPPGSRSPRAPPTCA